MGEILMQRYARLSDDGEDSDCSDHSIEILPPLLTRVLEEHGYIGQKELGRGSSGTVFLVKNTDGDLYVVKQMNSRDTKELVKVKEEVEILKSLDHGYIVSYLESFEDKEAGLFYIVMEYCEGGDLCKRMKAQKESGIFEEKQILDWFVQLCLALQYLHENDVLHRDIKPQNVFLTEDGYINLGDFGCSKVLESADAYAESVVGANLYVGPEVHKKKYNSKSDIWSLGWLLYDLCMLDVWSNIEERQFQQVFHKKGYTLNISERYSEELRKLIRLMISLDPHERPSAEEILEKPFLKDAVQRNQRIPEALQRRFITSIKTFDDAYNEHYEDFQDLVSEWGKITDLMESTHYSATAGSLSGSVIGAAGGITALAGLVLAPFTLGLSLIVTGIGVGVGVAGGVTGAASSITNAVKQNLFKESLKQLQEKYKSTSKPILKPLNTLRKVLGKIVKFKVFFSDSAFDNVQAACDVDQRRVLCAMELLNVGLLAHTGRIVAQTARVGRVAAEAVAGVLGGLLVILDITFIVMDSIDIHQMRQGEVNDPEKVRSSVLKSIAEMRKTHNELCNVLKEIESTREGLKDYIEFTSGDREIDNELNSLNK